MKKTLLLITILFYTGLSKSIARDGVSESITLRVQTLTDSFPANYSGYIQTFGEVNVRGAYSETIASLKDLSRITAPIHESQTLWNNTILTNLNNLESLEPNEKKQKAKKKNYKIWVTFMDDSYPYQGYLKELQENRILLTKEVEATEWEAIEIQNIKTMKYRKSGVKTKGAIIGGIAGVTLGAAIGFLSGNDEVGIDCEKKGVTSFSQGGNKSNSPLRAFFGLGRGSSQKSKTDGAGGECYSAADKALRNGTTMGLWGGLIGSIASSGRIIIPLNGKQKNYELRKPDLSAYKINN